MSSIKYISSMKSRDRASDLPLPARTRSTSASGAGPLADSDDYNQADNPESIPEALLMSESDFHERWNRVLNLLSICNAIELEAPGNKSVTEANIYKELSSHDRLRARLSRRLEKIPTAIHAIAVRDTEVIATTSRTNIDGFQAAIVVEGPLEHNEPASFQSWIVGLGEKAWNWITEWFSGIYLVTNPNARYKDTNMECISGIQFVKEGTSHLDEVLQLGSACLLHK